MRRPPRSAAGAAAQPPLAASRSEVLAGRTPQTRARHAVKRLDGPDKVTGRAKYTFDVNRPGMLYGRIVRSPHPHARIVSIDLSAAQRAPGVKAALMWRDPANAQRNTVMFQGDEVAAVAADTEERAIDAARLVKVEYEVLPHVISRRSGALRQAPAVFQPAATCERAQTQETGDIAAGFKQAAHTIEETYSTHVITHVCLESHGAVCEWDGDHLTAWVSTQGINAAREKFRQRPEHSAGERPRHHAVHGRRLRQQAGAGSAGPDLRAAGKEAKAPVKLMLDRKEEHLATGNRPSAAARIKAGVAADGMLTAFDAESWGTGGAGAAAGFPLPYIYQFPNRRRAHKDVFINTGQQRPMRAPGIRRALSSPKC